MTLMHVLHVRILSLELLHQLIPPAAIQRLNLFLGRHVYLQSHVYLVGAPPWIDIGVEIEIASGQA
eukprot:1118645-Pyramimonas_sp.AAC.1